MLPRHGYTRNKIDASRIKKEVQLKIKYTVKHSPAENFKLQQKKPKQSKWIRSISGKMYY